MKYFNFFRLWLNYQERCEHCGELNKPIDISFIFYYEDQEIASDLDIWDYLILSPSALRKNEFYIRFDDVKYKFENALRVLSAEDFCFKTTGRFFYTLRSLFLLAENHENVSLWRTMKKEFKEI